MQAMSTRAKAVQHANVQSAHAENGSSVSPHRLVVPPQQLGKMRRALETQEEGILKCQQKLALIQSSLNPESVVLTN